MLEVSDRLIYLQRGLQLELIWDLSIYQMQGRKIIFILIYHVCDVMLQRLHIFNGTVTV